MLSNWYYHPSVAEINLPPFSEIATIIAPNSVEKTAKRKYAPLLI